MEEYGTPDSTENKSDGEYKPDKSADRKKRKDKKNFFKKKKGKEKYIEGPNLDGTPNDGYQGDEIVNTDLDPGVYTVYDPNGGYRSSTPSKTGSTAGDTPLPSSHGTSTRELLEASDGKQHFGEDENKERGNWTGKLDFLLSCLGYAVGLGNVWRFPYLCYRNGGGAFFIPYIIMLTFVGIPLFFMELSLGQFCSNGPLTCWEFAPIFQGLGVAMMVVSGLVGIYYNMIIAMAIYYLFGSFTSYLPWQDCTNWWNTDHCSLLLPKLNCTGNMEVQQDNGSCTILGEAIGLWNESLYTNKTGKRRILPSEEYYKHRVLKMSGGIEDIGLPQWDLVLCLLLAWVIVFFCLIRGIKSSGKVVYFTALFPYLVLVILFFRGVTLDHAGDGIYFYVVPEWSRLLDAKVWNDAAVQIFFSLSTSWGGLITLASYNRFHNNVLRDSLIVTVGNCTTSIFAGFVIFSYLGYMANKLGTTVDKVVDSGSGLAFIVYPAAVTYMPISPLWSILFFIMLLTLGLDSQFALIETIVTCLLDRFPDLLRPKKSIVILIISIVFFLLGLPLCCNGGSYWLQLMDTYAGGWGLLVIGFCEAIALGWVYGSPRFFSDIETMTGVRPTMWWRVCWQGISPFLILAILLFAWIDYSPAKFGEYRYPPWADAIGWMMTSMSVVCIIGVAIYRLYKEEGPICERFRDLSIPTADWGPALVQHRKLIDYVDGFYEDPSLAHSTPSIVSGHSNPALSYSTNGLENGSYPYRSSMSTVGRRPGSSVHDRRYRSHATLDSENSLGQKSVESAV
ncbi:sodium- and chloride-dependent glycine transporter 1-like [Lineus longissimus]|uniref:sodium- and chloride-dependent glycine transporter 1-like n=1 Tax=Lineus longissimus TaxID=88925 RepID=UPI002B4DAEF9